MAIIKNILTCAAFAILSSIAVAEPDVSEGQNEDSAEFRQGIHAAVEEPNREPKLKLNKNLYDDGDDVQAPKTEKQEEEKVHIDEEY